MGEEFQRLFMMAEPEALSMNALAALGPVREPERSQYSHLIRHFLERFFNHETASPDGDAKARLVLIAFTAGLPGFVVALYLWPVYHPFPGWPPGRGSTGAPPSYWLQVNHHFFYVLYSFVAMGMVTVFEWDLFFPDLLDVFVLQTLPIAAIRVFRARVAAIAIFVAGFLFDANILAPLVLPAATDPPNLWRFLSGHLMAVAASGLYAAAFILALQGVLLAGLGERTFRRFSLLMQGLAITVLLLLLLLFPVLSRAVPVLLRSGSVYALCFPPFWFLGIYQRFLEGPSALPIYTKLAETGCVGLMATAGLAICAYPVAYVRRVRQLVEGYNARINIHWWHRAMDWLIHNTVARHEARRAVFHFISQTVLRVPRYRVYLVLYGGVGVAIVTAAALRVAVVHDHVRMIISDDGIRAATGIAAFWAIAGLRAAFVSPGNQRGSWVFRIVHGRPPQFETAMELLLAAEVWVFLWGLIVEGSAWLVLRVFSAPALLTWQATASQLLVAATMCLLLTDLFFMNVKIVAFTGEDTREQTNLAIAMLKYIAFVPAVALVPLFAEPWMERSLWNMLIAAGVVATAHLLLRVRRRHLLREYCDLPGLEEDEEEFPMKLGLRY